MVGYHVAGQADAARPGPVAQVLVGQPAAQISRDLIVKEGIGRRHRLRVAHHLLDGARGRASFPQADQPQAGESTGRQKIELLVRYLVQIAQVLAILARELVQPDVGVLGHHHDLGHPVQVRTEALRFHGQMRKVGRLRWAGAEEDRLLLLGDQIQTRQQAEDVLAQVGRPLLANKLKLALQRVGRGLGRRFQHVDQADVALAETWLAGEELAHFLDHLLVGCVPLQRRVVKQLAVRLEGRVGVGQPQQQHLFQCNLRVGIAGRVAGQELWHGHLALVDRLGGEIVDEFSQRILYRRRLQRLVEVLQRVAQRARIGLLAIGHDHQVQDLVDQRHRVDLAGFDSLFGVADQIAPFVHLVGELTGRAEVGNHHRAAQREERIVELIRVARLA